MSEVIDLLAHPRNSVKANAAAYLQHLSYMNDDAKMQIRWAALAVLLCCWTEFLVLVINSFAVVAVVCLVLWHLLIKDRISKFVDF